MKLSRLLEILNGAYPFASAIEGDRVGLQVQSGRDDARTVHFAFELTERVLAEAESVGADAIAVFHPLVFAPLSALVDSERVGRLITMLVQRGIALISVHTALDVHPAGTNVRLAEALGLQVSSPLAVSASFGMGVIADAGGIAGGELVARIADYTGSPVRYCEGGKETIRTVAIVAGSGMSYYGEVARSGVDAFITADCKYHDFHRAGGHLWLIDPGHEEMERHTAALLAELFSVELVKHGEHCSVSISQVPTSPVRFHLPPSKGGSKD